MQPLVHGDVLVDGAGLESVQRADRLGDRPLWSLRIALEITRGRNELEAVLLSILNPPPGTTPGG